MESTATAPADRIPAGSRNAKPQTPQNPSTARLTKPTKTTFSPGPPDPASSSLGKQETSGPRLSAPTYKAYSARYCDPEDLTVTDQTLRDYYGDDSPQYLNFNSCRVGAHFVRHDETGEIRVASHHCKNRWCPVCAVAKQARIASRIAAWLKTLARPRFLTLTMKHTTAPLSGQFHFITQAFKKFRKDPIWKDHVKGGVWSFQVTYNHDRDEFHPHIHALIDSDHFPQKLISRLWKHYTHGSTNVDIRLVRKPENAAQYVARYVSRPCLLSDLPPARRHHVIEECHGIRMINTFGNAHNAGLLTRETLDRAQWSYVGKWCDIHDSRNLDPYSHAIWNAWVDHVPLLSEDLHAISAAAYHATHRARDGPDTTQNTLPFQAERAL